MLTNYHFIRAFRMSSYENEKMKKQKYHIYTSKSKKKTQQNIRQEEITISFSHLILSRKQKMLILYRYKKS